jgi:Spy/CpxP family protein refolding chaperone
MKTSTKIIAAAAATLSLGAAGLVFASQTHPGPEGCSHQGRGMGTEGGHGGMRGGMGGADMAARATARLAELKTELKITTAQEPAWQQYEAVVRQQADSMQALRKGMQARMQDPKAMAEFDPQAQRESMLKLRESNQATRDSARQALYAVLTPEQKALADERLRAGHGGHMAMRGSAD